MRVLVTGATGYIGSALMTYLSARGFDVVGTSRNPAGGLMALREDHVQEDYARALQGADVVVHAAALAHVTGAHSAHIEKRYDEVNAQHTRILAQEAVRAGVKQFVFLSSLKVYGHSSDEVLTDLSLLMPEDPYGVSKVNAEAYVRASGIPSVILRIPLVYGPNPKAHLKALMLAVKYHIPLPLGGIDNRRSMIGLDNLCDAIECVIRSGIVSGKSYVVHDVTVSTTDLIRAIATAMGRRSLLFSLPPVLLRRAAAVLGKERMISSLIDSMEVDSSVFFHDFEWRPALSFEEQLCRMTSARSA